MEQIDLEIDRSTIERSPRLSGDQFCISRDESFRIAPPDVKLGSLFIWGGHADHRTWLKSSDGEIVGIILGTPIDYENRKIVSETFEFPFSAAQFLHKSSEVESFLYKLSGRWIAIFHSHIFQRIYLDVSGSLGLVFDPTQECAGSTAAALLNQNDYSNRFRSKLYEKLNIQHVGWFPSGLTAHHRLSRLLPNHYLDLQQWETVRHWPLASDLEPCCNPDEALFRIGQIVRQQAETMKRTGRVSCALTAGNETRLLLACLKDYFSEIDFVTFDFPGSDRDVTVAKRLTAQFSLNHRLFPAVAGNNDEAKEWIWNTGHCADGGHSRYWRSIEPLHQYDFFLGGIGGEVARGFLYRSYDAPGCRLPSTREILHRMGLPAEDGLIEATGQWLSRVPELDLFQLLDLAYIELRLGPWAFAASYTSYPTCQIHPLICREIFELMLQLPFSFKRGTPLLRLIEMYLPEALSIPINRYGDLRDQMAIVKKLGQPSRVKSKLRKLLG